MVEYEVIEQNLTESNTFTEIRVFGRFVTCRSSGAKERKNFSGYAHGTPLR